MIKENPIRSDPSSNQVGPLLTCDTWLHTSQSINRIPTTSPPMSHLKNSTAVAMAKSQKLAACRRYASRSASGLYSGASDWVRQHYRTRSRGSTLLDLESQIGGAPGPGSSSCHGRTHQFTWQIKGSSPFSILFRCFFCVADQRNILANFYLMWLGIRTLQFNPNRPVLARNLIATVQTSSELLADLMQCRRATSGLCASSIAVTKSFLDDNRWDCGKSRVDKGSTWSPIPL